MARFIELHIGEFPKLVNADKILFVKQTGDGGVAVMTDGDEYWKFYDESYDELKAMLEVNA